MVHFDPPLSSSVTVMVPSTLIPGSRLQLHATLSREEYTRLRHDGTQVQVWSDISSASEWLETSFEEEAAIDVPYETVEDVDLYLKEPASSPNSENEVLLVAAAPLPMLVGRTVQFTYRLVHADGSVSWLGSEGTNGSIFVDRTEGEGHLRAEDWSEAEQHGVFSCNASAGNNPVVVAKLDNGADWMGWAIGKECPSRFTALSSAITERIALTLLPKARPGAYVAYEPVLYHTTGKATLSLTDSGEVRFHAEDEESILHASISTSTWKNCIGHEVTALDLQTRHFLGVTIQNNSNMGRICFLPVSGSQAIITLISADVKSLVSPSSTVALLAPTLHAPTFLTSSPPDHHLRVAVGPAGGEVLVLPGYSLQGNKSEWSMAFFPHGPGSVTAISVDTEQGAHFQKPSSASEDVASESTSEKSIERRATVETHPSGHSSNIEELLLVIVYFFRILLELVSGSISSTASPASFEVRVDERTHLLAEDKEQHTPEAERLPGSDHIPTLTFNVTGKYTLFMRGEDVSKILVRVDGTLLETTPNGGASWVIESDADTECALLEVALHE